MTDSRIYVDTAPFIYFLEKSALYFDVARSFFIDCKNQSFKLFTSTVTIEEFCVYPLSHNDRQAIVNFETFLNGMNIDVVPVDKNIALKAAEIRAKYTGFKALDAIHLATCHTHKLRCIHHKRQATAPNEGNPCSFHGYA